MIFQATFSTLKTELGVQNVHGGALGLWTSIVDVDLELFDDYRTTEARKMAPEHPDSCHLPIHSRQTSQSLKKNTSWSMMAANRFHRSDEYVDDISFFVQQTRVVTDAVAALRRRQRKFKGPIAVSDMEQRIRTCE